MQRVREPEAIPESALPPARGTHDTLTYAADWGIRVTGLGTGPAP
jgi:hypothetical protein